MELFIFLEILSIFLLALFLLNRYAARSISLVIKSLVFIPWFLCFLVIILVPMDVYYARRASLNPESTSEKDTLVIVWRIVYWTTFVMTWAVLPMLQQFVEAGEFTTEERFKRAFRNVLFNYGVMIIFGIAFVIYLLVSGRFKEYTLREVMMTFSNCFGVFLIILCLGFGLVHIPKRYLQKTNKQINLKYHQFQLAEADDDRTNLQIDLEDLIKLIHLLSLKGDIDIGHKSLLNAILSQVPDETIKVAKQTLNAIDNETAEEFGKVTHKKIVGLNRKLKKMLLERTRLENKYDTTLRAALLAEDVLESPTAEAWSQRSNAAVTGTFSKLSTKFGWLWYTKIEQVAFFIFGCAFVVLSIFAFFAEVLTLKNISFFNLNNLIQPEDSFFKNQVVCLVPLLYISLCVYTSLFQMKLGGIYGLYSGKHTDAASLVFSSVNFTRVSTPLVFNFLQMVKVQNTAFIEIMGQARFATSFTQYCPLLLIVLILCNSFDVYGRVLSWIGLSRFKFSENFNDDKIEEGRLLLQKARKGGRTTSYYRDTDLENHIKAPNEVQTMSLNTKLLGRAADVTDIEDDESQPPGSPDKLMKKGIRK